MKRILSYSIAAMVAVAASCSVEPIVEPNLTLPEASDDLQSLVAIVPNSDTKIEFTDTSGSGITLAWEENDSFSVYEVNGKWISDFVISDLTESTFVAQEGGSSLVDGVQYIALYPARPSAEASHAEYMAYDFTASQTADAATPLDHFNSCCQMSDEFTLGESIAFAHNKAIMTIQFDDIPAGETPTKVQLSDGTNKNYELLLNGMAASEVTASEFYPLTVYEVHLMIDPVEAASRDLTFTVTYTDGANIYNITTSYEYLAGYRYTAPVKNQNEQQAATWWQAIGTADELATYLNGSSFKNTVLTADIDLDGYTITPLSNGTAKIFDGNGYTISNLTINTTESAATQTALFRNLNSGGVIKNLTLDSPEINGYQYVGAIVGKMATGSSVVNCTVINGSVYAANNNVGGIAGQCLGTISGCSYSGKVVSNTNNAGGITGVSTTADCCVITNCIVDAEVSGTQYLGGIAGKVNGATISGCVNKGEISGSGTTIGGIVGYGAGVASEIIFGCVNSGAIVGTTKVGGIAGSLTYGGTIAACYNIGTIGKADFTTGSTAGIIGEAKTTTNVIGCYNSSDFGTPTNSGNIGQITGYINATDAVTNIIDCYFVSPDALSAKGERCDDIAALNAVVANMNTAINDTEYNSFNFIEGIDASTDLPTLIAQ